MSCVVSIVTIESFLNFTVKRLAFSNKSQLLNTEMSTVSIHAFVFEHDMKDLTRYANIVIAMIRIKQLKYKIVPGNRNTRASSDMKRLTKHAIKVSAVKLIIKLLKKRIFPETNNTKATIAKSKITKLTQFIITEVVVVFFV